MEVSLRTKRTIATKIAMVTMFFYGMKLLALHVPPGEQKFNQDHFLATIGSELSKEKTRVTRVAAAPAALQRDRLGSIFVNGDIEKVDSFFSMSSMLILAEIECKTIKALEMFLNAITRSRLAIVLTKSITRFPE
jgi:hypothetical protein